MLRHTTRCGLRASHALREPRHLRRVKVLPRGMLPFDPLASSSPSVELPQSLHEGAAASSAKSTTSSSQCSSPTPAAAGDHNEVRCHHRRRLPPWPVDRIEFNALSVDGGHSARVAAEENISGDGRSLRGTALYHSSDDGVHGDVNDDYGAVTGADPVPKTVPLTQESLERLTVEEECPAAQAALAVGGWVCTGCWTVQGADAAVLPEVAEMGRTDSDAVRTENHPVKLLFPRTICPTCLTLRHDAQAWSLLSAFRRAAVVEPQWWICRRCGEVNHHHHNGGSTQDSPPTSQLPRAGSDVCRCCGDTPPLPGPSPPTFPQRQTVEEEVAAGAVGAIIVTRNRTTRWRCGGCGEVNSLQMSECRNCARERFALTVCCPRCEAPRQLSNALVCHGGHPTTATATFDAIPVFSPLNCFYAGSTQLACLQCGHSLHGGVVQAVVHGAASWWCACGVTSPVLAYSCSRCRLPRTVSSPSLLQELLRATEGREKEVPSAPRWDFAKCTNWLCDSCDGVNHAAYQVIRERVERAAYTPAPSASMAGQLPETPTTPTTTIRKRKVRAWVDGAQVECGHCGAPWHHHLLQGGEWWRCACHALNRRGCTTCTSCGLPALDGLSAIVLSSWSHGDWWCSACGTHCYRERLRCRCGASRPTPV
jgi:hypothetical protein